MELTALDARYAVRELAQFSGAKVEKVLQHDAEKRDLLMTMYLQGSPKLHLRLMPGYLGLQAQKPGHYPKVPPGFAMFLRKYLGGARLVAARQHGFDRIVELDFDSRHGQLTLVIELIPPGNVVLVMDGKIKGLLETQNFKDRTLRGGIPYEPPPASIDPEQASAEELAQIITTSTKNSIVTALAIELGLGGIYAEEACARAGIEKHRSDLKQDEVRLVVSAVKELFAQEVVPCRDEKRAYPFPMRSRAIMPAEEALFLSALGSLIEDQPVVEERRVKPVKDKLAVMLAAQEKQIRKFERESEEAQRAGERIYEEYQLMSEIIRAAQQARTKKEDVKAALSQFPQVRDYDAESGEITVELEDA